MPATPPMKERNFTTRCGLWQSVHSAWRCASRAFDSMKSAPQRFAGPVQSTEPSLKLPPMSCTSSVAPPCSGVVMGMRTADSNSVSMLGTCGEAFKADFAAVVWHW
jgi:hypothetical protein